MGMRIGASCRDLAVAPRQFAGTVWSAQFSLGAAAGELARRPVHQFHQAGEIRGRQLARWPESDQRLGYRIADDIARFGRPYLRATTSMRRQRLP